MLSLRLSPLILLAIMLLPPFATCDFDVEFSSNATYTDNVLGSNGAPIDRYTQQSAAVQYYPFSFLKLSGSTDISTYRKAIDLGTYSGGIGAELIPLPVDSRLMLYLYANFNARRYRSYDNTFFAGEVSVDPNDGSDNNSGEIEPLIDFENFETDVLDARAIAGYRFSEGVRLRGGVSFRSSNYINNESSDQRIVELFTGGYVGLPYSNALDVEIGVSFSGFEAVVPGPYTIPYGPNAGKPAIYNQDGLNLSNVSSSFNSIYFSPRISRPIGYKTGLSLTATYRKFGGTGGSMVLSDGVENVSPWQSTYQGTGISVAAKTYLIPKVITTGGFAFYNKEYIMIMDVAELTAAEEKWEADSSEAAPQNRHLSIWEFYLPQLKIREDISRQYYINLQVPMTVSPDFVIEPSINLQYIHNTSNKSLYRYSNTTVALGLRIRM